METGKRQRSVSQPKVHPVGEGGSAEVLQQAGCKQDDAADSEGCLQEQHSSVVNASNTQEYQAFSNVLFVVRLFLHQGQRSQSGDEN